MTLPIIFIVGPTCIGKSALSLKIAEKLNGEIINADSMQVYSNLDILTARPSKKDLSKVAHHLYGYVDGSYRYNVANWCEDVMKIINKNINKNVNSIIVGGTGMYIDKLLNGLIELPSIPESIKIESENLLNKVGIRNFSNEVRNIDKQAMNNILKNDVIRIRRIWEVYRYTKKNMSYWLSQKNKKYLSNNKTKILLFLPFREKIYKRVNERFINMINNGAIEEVKKLNSLKLKKSLPIMRAHGVPEISDYLSGLISLDECIQKGQQVTRNYVKRQFTWWKSSNLDNIHSSIEFPNEIDENSLEF